MSANQPHVPSAADRAAAEAKRMRLQRKQQAAAVTHQDVYNDELAVITKCQFGKFGDAPPDGADIAGQDGSRFQNATELYKALHKEMETLECSRCNMKGHTRAACWYGTQLNLTARKLGGRFKKNYAAVRRRFGAMRKRLGKVVADTDNRRAKITANRVSHDVLQDAFPDEANQLFPAFEEDPDPNQN